MANFFHRNYGEEMHKDISGKLLPCASAEPTLIRPPLIGLQKMNKPSGGLIEFLQ